ncbi:MAG: hypothetical protein EBY17_01190 [Acidobacteriia bacterium]|nr:hypothetical protein [Terriglobia bacterium]
MLHQLTELLVAWGPAGIFLLSILDSSGVPVAGVFDAMLILISAKNPAVAWLCAGMAVVGSMVGSTILFSAARSGSGRFAKQPEPGTRAARFRSWFRRYGLVTVFIPALMPIPMPLKLFVISAGVLGTTFRQFISVLLAARILRYFGEAWLGVQLGMQSTDFLKAHVVHFSVGALVLAALLIGWIKWRDANVPAPAGTS